MKVYLAGVEYQICDHASKRMIRRGVTRADIQACLDDHQVSPASKEGYSLCIANNPTGKSLQVVLNTEAKEIVTVMWLD